MSNITMYDRLSEPFPAEMEREVQKGGARLIYIPISEVINRMNRIFGPLGWSQKVNFCSRDEKDPNWVIAHVTVTAEIIGDNGLITKASHDGFGGVEVKYKKNGEILDLGNDYKGAVSDAVKKACQHFGIGLYLARDVTAIEVDEASHGETPEMLELREAYNRFRDIRETLTPDQVAKLKEYWSSYSDNRPTPKPSEFTIQELKAMTVEALRISLNGEMLVDTSEEEKTTKSTKDK